MVFIYCIEDINDLKYVGKTNQKLNDRFTQHKYSHKRGNCSSGKLNLYNSIIYILEECLEELSVERERYWINKIDCVNQRKLNGEDLQRSKLRRQKRNKLLKLSKNKNNHL
jgi:hypothetical protein